GPVVRSGLDRRRLREIDFGPSHGRSDHANRHKSHASAGLARVRYWPMRRHVRSWGRAMKRASLPRRMREFIMRSEEHTSELQSLTNLVCRLLLEKKKIPTHTTRP